MGLWRRWDPTSLKGKHSRKKARIANPEGRAQRRFILQKAGGTSLSELLRCLTNNPRIPLIAREVSFLSVSSYGVLLTARDLIHKGWVLLTHPLYGNLSPSKNPYRTLLIKNPHVESPHPLSCHLESLKLIEEALSAYSSCASHKLFSGVGDVPLKNDFAWIDVELMRESLLSYSLWL